MGLQQFAGHMLLQSEFGRDVVIVGPCALPPSVGEQAEASTDLEAASNTALIVDDDPDVLEVLVSMFRIMGYETLAASSGAEALEHLRRKPKLDVMLSDVVMPGMDGVSLAREALQLLPGLHIILASGFTREHRHDLGTFPFLQKPFLMADVARLLRQRP